MTKKALEGGGILGLGEGKGMRAKREKLGFGVARWEKGQGIREARLRSRPRPRARSHARVAKRAKQNVEHLVRAHTRCRTPCAHAYARVVERAKQNVEHLVGK